MCFEPGRVSAHRQEEDKVMTAIYVTMGARSLTFGPSYCSASHVALPRCVFLKEIGHGHDLRGCFVCVCVCVCVCVFMIADSFNTSSTLRILLC